MIFFRSEAYFFILGFSALTPFRFLSSCSFTIIAIWPVFDFGLPLAEFMPPCDTSERIIISYNLIKGFIVLKYRGCNLLLLELRALARNFSISCFNAIFSDL